MDKAEKDLTPKHEKEKKDMTKASLIDKQIIDSCGNAIGKVIDIAFPGGQMGLSLIVETKKGEPTEIACESIQAVGDFIVLKPPGGSIQSTVVQAEPARQTQGVPSRICPNCGAPLTYIPQYQRWYCYKDGKYV